MNARLTASVMLVLAFLAGPVVIAGPDPAGDEFGQSQPVAWALVALTGLPDNVGLPRVSGGPNEYILNFSDLTPAGEEEVASGWVRHDFSGGRFEVRLPADNGESPGTEASEPLMGGSVLALSIDINAELLVGRFAGEVVVDFSRRLFCSL